MAINVDDKVRRPTIWAEIKWNSKDADLQTPNLVLGTEKVTVKYEVKVKVKDEQGNVVKDEQGNEVEKIEVEEKTNVVTKYAVPPGTKKNLSIEGVIESVTVFQKPGYNDRDKVKYTNAMPEKNQWDLCVRLVDNLEDKTAPVYALHTVLKTDTDQLDSNAANLLNVLCAHTQGVEEGKISAEMPIRFEFYQTPQKNQDGTVNPAYFNKHVKLLAPTGFNEASELWEFNDPRNSIKSADLPARREPVIINGKHLEVNGVKAYDYQKMFEWMEPRVAYVTGFYKKDAQKQSNQQTQEQGLSPSSEQTPAETKFQPIDEDGVDLGTAVDDAFDNGFVDQAEQGAQRPRITA